jgi:hypothetical protein
MFKISNIIISLSVLSAIFNSTKASLPGTWQEGDFEEFYTSTLNTTRYPNATVAAPV